MECQLSSRLYTEGGGETGEEKGGYVGHREFVWVLSSSFLHFLAFPPYFNATPHAHMQCLPAALSHML